jgi:hypothetical protein
VNYLAHAIRVLDDPYQVAGTSLPDWLRVVDKRARVKPEGLVARGDVEERVRDGVVRHHRDDLAFHTNSAFEELTHDAVHAIRALSPDPRMRASALGHIVVEMLLDACIEEMKPGATAAYYDALAHVDVDVVVELARRWTGHELQRMPELFARFCAARFLFQYAGDDGVVDALAGVAWRAGISAPPAGSVAVVARLRPRVRDAATDLLRFHS